MNFMNKRICVWGASITQGHCDYKKGGWAQRFWFHFVNEYDGKVSIYNLGISGATTTDIIKRFDAEAKARNPYVIIFAVGNNDSLFDKKEGDCRTPIELFESNFNQLIKKARKYTHQVVLIGLTKVVDEKTSPISYADNLFYNNKDIKKYDAIIQKVAKENDIPYCPMFDLLDKKDLPDGLHPNEVGHEKMFHRIKDFLIKNNLIEKVKL